MMKGWATRDADLRWPLSPATVSASDDGWENVDVDGAAANAAMLGAADGGGGCGGDDDYDEAGPAAHSCRGA